MRHFPVFLDLSTSTALVLGEGDAATRKATALARAGATIRTAKVFSPNLLDGCAIAIGADAPDDQLTALATAARARGIPVNIVDRPALCSYISPALVERGPLTIAVSSGGDAPVLARLIRARIEALLPANLGDLAAFAARFRDRIRAALPSLPAKHPTLTIMANADRIGRAIAEAVQAGRSARPAELPSRRNGYAAA